MKRKIFIFSLLFLFSLSVRLAVYWQSPVLSRDACEYLRVAEFVFQRGGFNDILSSFPDWTAPPLFISLIVLLMHCGLTAEAAGVTINVLCGVAVSFFAAGIAWELFHRKSIFFGTFLLASCHPILVQLSGEVQRDMPYLFLMGGGFWLLCRAFSRPHWGYCAGAGISFALAILTRYEALEILLILFVIGVIAEIAAPKYRKRIAVYALVLGTAATLSAYFVVQASGSREYLQCVAKNSCFHKAQSVARSFRLFPLRTKK